MITAVVFVVSFVVLAVLHLGLPPWWTQIDADRSQICYRGNAPIQAGVDDDKEWIVILFGIAFVASIFATLVALGTRT